MSQAQPTYEGTKAKALDAVTNIKGDFEELSKIGRKMADESFEQVGKSVKEYLSKSQEKLANAEGKFESVIQKYPVRSLLVAAGLGFLVAFLRRK